MTEPTIEEFLSQMTAAFRPEKAAGIDTTIQLKLTGSQEGEWYLTIKDSACTLTPGTVPAPKLTVNADSADFIKIFTGQLDGMQAFMQGKLRLGGDINLALKLMNLFKM
jgi:putative sterol carrier protein